MRLVFHLSYFQAGRIGGQEGVIRRLAAGLAGLPLAPDQQMFALCPPAEYDALAGMCPWTDIVPVAADTRERTLTRTLRNLRPDLYLCPMAVIEPSDPPCPTVVLIPDLQHDTYPEFFTPETLANRRRAYGAAVERADLILTLSGYARGTILARYPRTSPERVLVFTPAVDPLFDAPDGDLPSLASLHLPAAYLLYPANFWPHKNHVRLLEGLVRLRGEGLEPPLVLTGDPGSGFDQIAPQIERLGLSDQVNFLGRLPIERFVPLLRGARALVFPSLYEGLGLPILEAFHSDTPVLCSSVTSCPEVAGDAALFVDPTSVSAIAEGLRRIWRDADLRADLVDKGRRRKDELSWDRSFAAIRSALLALASRPRRRSYGIGRFLRAFGVGSLTP